MERKWPSVVVNAHTLISGVIGVISLLLPWVVEDGNEKHSIVDIIAGGNGLGMSLDFLLPLAAIIFLMGTILIFVSPLGVIAQIGGTSGVIFLAGIASLADSGSRSIEVGFGAYIGLISGAVAFTSMAFPFGFGYTKWSPLGNRGRTYTFSFYRNVEDSDGLPFWWWLWPGRVWYWWVEMRMGWAFRDLYRERRRLRAERIARKEAAREFGDYDLKLDDSKKSRP